MPAKTREELERELAEAEAFREKTQEWLDETEGWDDLPRDVVDEFVNGGASEGKNT